MLARPIQSVVGRNVTQRHLCVQLFTIFFFEMIAVIISAAAIYYTERGVWCDHLNNMCDGTAMLSTGPGWYAIPGTYPGATFSVGCTSAAGMCRRKSQFENVLVAAYWCVTTVTTTGYGDYVPETVGGKVIAFTTMVRGRPTRVHRAPIGSPQSPERPWRMQVLGLVALALPITVLSENFAHVYQRQELLKCVTPTP
jgi:hypothetical protein